MSWLFGPLRSVLRSDEGLYAAWLLVSPICCVGFSIWCPPLVSGSKFPGFDKRFVLLVLFLLQQTISPWGGERDFQCKPIVNGQFVYLSVRVWERHGGFLMSSLFQNSLGYCISQECCTYPPLPWVRFWISGLWFFCFLNSQWVPGSVATPALCFWCSVCVCFSIWDVGFHILFELVIDAARLLVSLAHFVRFSICPSPSLVSGQNLQLAIYLGRGWEAQLTVGLLSSWFVGLSVRVL